MRVFLIILLALLASTPASALDRNREGFVFGLGLGFAPEARVEVDLVCDGQGMTREVSNIALAQHYFFGYGWNESDILALELHLSSFAKDPDDLRCPPSAGSWSWSISFGTADMWHQAFLGPVWYHYFAKPGRSLYTVAGIGWASHDSLDEVDMGLGLLAGTGVELTDRISLEARLFRGRSRYDYSEAQYRTFSVSFLLNATWY